MTTLSSFNNLYVDFRHAFLIIDRKDGSRVLRIFNEKQLDAYNLICSPRFLRRLYKADISSRNNLPSFLESLVKQRHLHKKYLPRLLRETSTEECIEALSKTINELTSRIFIRTLNLKDMHPYPSYQYQILQKLGLTHLNPSLNDLITTSKKQANSLLEEAFDCLQKEESSYLGEEGEKKKSELGELTKHSQRDTRHIFEEKKMSSSPSEEFGDFEMIEENDYKEQLSLSCSMKEGFTSCLNDETNEIIEDFQKCISVTKLLNFKKETPTTAKRLFQEIQDHLVKKEYNKALKVHELIFQMSNEEIDRKKFQPLLLAIQEEEKVTLIVLYLILYQLENKEIAPIIKMVKAYREQLKTSRFDLILIHLYELQKQEKKALEFGTLSAKENPELAILIYKHFLTKNPELFDFYSPLAQLLDSPYEKIHILSKGVCQAIQSKRNGIALLLWLEAKQENSDSQLLEIISKLLPIKNKKSE